MNSFANSPSKILCDKLKLKKMFLAWFFVVRNTFNQEKKTYFGGKIVFKLLLIERIIKITSVILFFAFALYDFET